MNRYDSETTARFDQQFAEYSSETNARLRKRRQEKAMTPHAQTSERERNPFFWIDAMRTAMHTTDCNEKRRTLSNAADELEAALRADAEKIRALEADAARWRYVRQRGLLGWSGNFGESRYLDSADAAIDAALAATQSPRSEAGEDK